MYRQGVTFKMVDRRKGKQINFRLSDELAEQFEEYCRGRGITQTQFLENSIRQALGLPLTIPPDALGDNQRIATGEPVNTQPSLLELYSRLEARIATLESQQGKREAA